MEIGTGRKMEGKTHPSPKNLADVQRQKSFPHFTATDSERKERARFQQRSRLKQTRHCAFPVWTGARPRPVTCTTAFTASLPLAPALCETELGHLSVSVSLPPARAQQETECFWFFVFFSPSWKVTKYIYFKFPCHSKMFFFFFLRLNVWTWMYRMMYGSHASAEGWKSHLQGGPWSMLSQIVWKPILVQHSTRTWSLHDAHRLGTDLNTTVRHMQLRAQWKCQCGTSSCHLQAPWPRCLRSNSWSYLEAAERDWQTKSRSQVNGANVSCCITQMTCVCAWGLTAHTHFICCTLAMTKSTYEILIAQPWRTGLVFCALTPNQLFSLI